MHRPSLRGGAERGGGGGIPTPSLYKVLGTHQHSKNHEIRGQYGRNSYVLEIVKKGVFLHRKMRDLKKKDDIFNRSIRPLTLVNKW